MTENLNHWKFQDLELLLTEYTDLVKEQFELNRKIKEKHNTILHLTNIGLTKLVKEANG